MKHCHDEDFISSLDKVKNPFIVDLPKPVVTPEPLVKPPGRRPKRVPPEPQDG